jgi:Phage protein (N4 Gp49/phage Sf6 gene 66) family
MALGPDITLQEAQEIVETKTAPRVTQQSIEARIKAVRYLSDGVLTVCIIEMVNGFKAVGKSAPASPENFDREVGHRYAYEDAFRQLWPLEAYLLLEKMRERPNIEREFAIPPEAER